MSTQHEGPAAMSPLWIKHTTAPTTIPPVGPTDLLIRVPRGARDPRIADVRDAIHDHLRALIHAHPLSTKER